MSTDDNRAALAAGGIMPARSPIVVHTLPPHGERETLTAGGASCAVPSTDVDQFSTPATLQAEYRSLHDRLAALIKRDPLGRMPASDRALEGIVALWNRAARGDAR